MPAYEILRLVECASELLLELARPRDVAPYGRDGGVLASDLTRRGQTAPDGLAGARGVRGACVLRRCCRLVL